MDHTDTAFDATGRLTLRPEVIVALVVGIVRHPQGVARLHTVVAAVLCAAPDNGNSVTALRTWYCVFDLFACESRASVCERVSV